MTTMTLSLSNLQHIHLFEDLASALHVPFKKIEHNQLSETMLTALEDEKLGRVTKLKSHKNAVAEILG